MRNYWWVQFDILKSFGHADPKYSNHLSHTLEYCHAFSRIHVHEFYRTEARTAFQEILEFFLFTIYKRNQKEKLGCE